jgi:hypothetical protein
MFAALPTQCIILEQENIAPPNGITVQLLNNPQDLENAKLSIKGSSNV